MCDFVKKLFSKNWTIYDKVLCVSLGAAIGFIAGIFISPVKYGITLGSNNGCNNGSHNSDNKAYSKDARFSKKAKHLKDKAVEKKASKDKEKK